MVTSFHPATRPSLSGPGTLDFPFNVTLFLTHLCTPLIHFLLVILNVDSGEDLSFTTAVLRSTPKIPAKAFNVGKPPVAAGVTRHFVNVSQFVK